MAAEDTHFRLAPLRPGRGHGTAEGSWGTLVADLPVAPRGRVARILRGLISNAARCRMQTMRAKRSSKDCAGGTRLGTSSKLRRVHQRAPVGAAFRKPPQESQRCGHYLDAPNLRKAVESAQIGEPSTVYAPL